MPPLELDQNSAKFQIQAYQSGMIKVNGKTFTKSIIITPNDLIQDWAPQNATELTADSFLAILTLKPDVLLIGTGCRHILLPVDLYGELINHGIGVEIMETGAACRTFNALCSENRNVVAALVIS